MGPHPQHYKKRNNRRLHEVPSFTWGMILFSFESIAKLLQRAIFHLTVKVADERVEALVIDRICVVMPEEQFQEWCKNYLVVLGQFKL